LKTAFLIDADFFLRRLRLLRGDQIAEDAVRDLISLCVKHLELLDRPLPSLYRIFVYDCPPLAKPMHLPVSKCGINLSKTPTYSFRTAFHQNLRTQRKIALRMGVLRESFAHWQLRAEPLRQLLAGKRRWEELTDDDFSLEVKQSGVDMRIGLDIASIATKRLADQIVLVAGDADFIPAAKMARREGVDFVLDPMGAPVPAELLEHIDGVQTVLTRADGGRPT
jgi:uncharacterized LabA/DUF88 family protein